jgi:hypothetical protein
MGFAGYVSFLLIFCSEAESFRHMKIKIFYTHADGHVVKDSGN